MFSYSLRPAGPTTNDFSFIKSTDSRLISLSLHWTHTNSEVLLRKGTLSLKLLLIPRVISDNLISLTKQLPLVIPNPIRLSLSLSFSYSIASY
jgi:hypothetical protein